MNGNVSSNFPGVPKGHHGPGSVGTEGISPQLFLHAARRWWKIAIPCAVLLGVAAAALVWTMFEEHYTASAIIRIETNRHYIAFPSPPSPPQRFIQTQIELLHSPMVLTPLLSQPDILQQEEIQTADNALAFLQQHLKVRQVGESDLFNVEYTSSSPPGAATVVNAAVNSYLDYQSRFDAKRNDAVISLLEKELTKHGKNVERLRNSVRILSEEANVVPSFLQRTQPARDISDPVVQLQTSLTEAEVQEIELLADIRFAEAEAQQEILIPDEVVSSQADQELAERRSRLADRRRELESLASRFRDEKQNVQYRQYVARLEEDERALETTRQEVELRLRSEFRQQERQRRAANLFVLKGQLARIQQTITTLTEKRDAELAEGTKSRSNQLDLDFANKELDEAQNVYDVLHTRITQLRTESSAPTWISLENAAKPPTSPVTPAPFKHMVLAFLAAICLPFGVASAWEYALKRVNATNEIEQQVGLTVVGEIVTLPRVRMGLASRKRLAYGRHLFEESVDGLTTSLVLSESLRDMRVLALASAVSSEGKTSVATELAISIARSTGSPTLLIDGDMRAPDVHRLFDLPVSPGLAELLAGESCLRDAVMGTECHYLDILPAGVLASSPHRLLSSDIFSQLLEEAKAEYRYIIIDTPPVLAASEALLLAKQADAVLLCAMRDRTRLTQLQGAHIRMVSAGINSVGVVMSGVPTQQYASRYGSYSYSKSPRGV